MMNVLVTGATGFVGTALVKVIEANADHVEVLLRNQSKDFSKSIKQQFCNLEDASSLSLVDFSSIDCVIHLAARAHVMRDSSLSPLAVYRAINRDGTLLLAKLAAKAGVKRFINLSSIKVNGELTSLEQPFVENDCCNVNDPYGLSKYEAEIDLLKLASDSGMEVVIIRPPLVYGPGVKANFASMIRWVKKGIPLPFGMVGNKRSLIAIDNLVDFILLCADSSRSPKAANQVFLVSDGEDVSTTTLLRKVARAYGAKSRLWPVPVSFMRLAAKLLGKSDMADRLFGNLQVDSSKACELLGWKPVVTMDKQLRKMAEFDKAADKL